MANVDDQNHYCGCKMHANRLLIERAGRSAILRLELDANRRSLNPKMLYEISCAFDEVSRDPAVDSICLTSSSPDFIVGADVKFFASCVLGDDLGSLVDFTNEANQLLRRIEQSLKPVVAWIRGTAMGAGLEIALACHRIVAGPKARFAFPEVGIGIYPGMGGTQRMPRRVGMGLAKWMVFTGSIVPADQAAQIGLVDLVRPETDSAEEIVAAATSVAGGSQSREPRSLETRFQSLEALFANHSVSELCDSAFPQPAEAQAIRALVQLRGKSQSALLLAERIMNGGMQLSLEDGLAEETSHLLEAFNSPDARRGVLAAAGVSDQAPSEM